MLRSPWTWMVLAALGFGVLAMKLERARRRWKRGWLSGLIDARSNEIRHAIAAKKKPDGKSGWRGRWNHLRLSLIERYDALYTHVRTVLPAQIWDVHVPTLISFVLVAVVIALFFLAARWPAFSWVFPPPFASWWTQLRADLDAAPNSKTGELVIGAFTGLVVVVIALIVFVAESIRDDRDLERKRVLLRISMLWPLSIAATLIPFGFLWAAARGLTVVLEAFVAALTLFGFARVVRNLLDPEARAANRLSLLRDRTRKLIGESIRERIGNSILLERIGANKPIGTLAYLLSDAFLERRTRDYVFIDAPQDGWLEDIQLEELGSLMGRLDRYARDRLGFGLRVRERQWPRAAAPESHGAHPPVSLPEHPAYLMKRFRDEIPPDSIFYARRRALLALPKAFEREPQILAEIRADIGHIFRFTTAEPTSVLFRREMQAIKDQLAGAIRTGAFGSIEDLRQTYVTIAEEFLTELLAYGSGYSVEQARQERGNIFQSWTEIRWLQDDLRELITIAIDSGNTDVMGTIAFLPFSIATRAVLAKDNYLFQQFMNFALFLYYRGVEKPAGPVRTWLVDKAWRYPKEIADFTIGRTFDDEDASVSDLEQMQGFALYTYRILQDLLKGAVDQRDPETFAIIAAELSRLFATFRQGADPGAVDGLDWQIEQTQDPAERATLQTERDILAKRVSVAAELNRSHNEILLVLGGRALGVLLVHPEDGAVRQLLDAVRSHLTSDPREIADAFAAASDYRASDFWDWHGWDLVADGEAHFIDVHTKLNQMFALRMLELLAAMTPPQRDALVFPDSATLSEMARENNEQGLLRTLADIDAHPDKWRPVLPDGVRGLTGVLRQRLAAMREAERAREAAQTRDAPLDNAIVAQFQNAVVRSLRDMARLRAILNAYGAVDFLPDDHPGPTLRSLGFNQVDDKTAYIAQDRTHFAGWGEAYGQGLAHSEDEVTFEQMIAGAVEQASLARGSIVDGIVTAIGGMKHPIVLQSLEHAEENEIRRHGDFTPKYHETLRSSPLNKLNGFMGELSVGERKIALFDAFVRIAKLKGKVLVLDAADFVRWRQYAPDDVPEERPFITDLVLVRVRDLNVENATREEILQSDPEWLRAEVDKEAYLRGRVLVNIYEKFRIEIRDPKAARCLTIARRTRREE